MKIETIDDRRDVQPEANHLLAPLQLFLVVSAAKRDVMNGACGVDSERSVTSLHQIHLSAGEFWIDRKSAANIAFIGVGSQGLRVMLRFLKEPDVQGVAVCDPNKASADYPQWDTHEFCKSVRNLLGRDSGWDWLSPDQPIELTHSLKVTSGVAGREPCQQIVNAYYASTNLRKIQRLRCLQ